MATGSEATKKLVFDMEDPLCTLDDLLSALSMIAREMEGDARPAVERLVSIAREKCGKVLEIHLELILATGSPGASPGPAPADSK